MRAALALPLIASLAAAGCTGNISEPTEFCDLARPGPSPMRRLTRFEYNNTVRDLLGDTTRPGGAFAPEEESLGFDNQATSLTVSPLLAEQYMAAAEAVAARAVEDLPALLPCDPAGAGDDACAAAFIDDFGARAFRRPLSDGDRGRLTAVYEFGRDEGGFALGIQMVVQTALQSPHFLYRVEHGVTAGADERAVPLSGYEMASRLSYLLWGSMPDAALFEAAANGQLATRGQVAEQARRMLADPRAHAAIANFYTQWLMLEHIDALEKDSEIYPAFYPELRPLLARETEALLDHIIWDGSGDVGEMLTASYTFMNDELAAFYGVDGPAGEAFERVELDSSQRAGFLTHAGVLAAHAKHNQSSPIHRGKFVREQLLCNQLPPPPDNIVVNPPDLDPDLTTRERFSQHASDPACSGCHELIDPIGFGFEHYDGVGHWRADENGLPIDASGELIATDVDGPFDGAVELARALAQSEQVYDCVVTQWFRFAYGRGERQEDVCTMADLSSEFSASGHDMRELIVALTQTDAFMYKTVEQ